MRLGIGLGLFKAGLISAGVRIFSAFQTRVIGDGGTVESGNCVVNGINSSALLQQASLLLIPSGYKGGKLYAEIPTNGNGDLTWTRGGDAFRTNASGLIQRVPWNLLRYSEEFDNSAWTKASATVTANATTAPNGTLTADKVIATNTASTTRAIYQSFTPSSSQRFNFSVYAKASEYSRLALQEIGGGRFGASFDLSAQTTASLGGAGFVSSSISNVGNGWFLCSVVWDGVAGSGAALTTIGYPAGATISAAGTSYAGDGTSGIFIWGAQLVEGTTTQTYLPTTDRLNFPRLSYMYGSCPSALLEPQRTNSIRNSVCSGSVTGTPGTYPTNWSAASTGLTQSVVAIGTENGLNYIDLRFNGTSLTTLVRITPDISTAISATNNQTWTTSNYAKLISGSYDSSAIGFIMRNSGGGNLGIFSTTTILTSTLQRFSYSATTNNALTAYVHQFIDFYVTSGVSYDFTVRIAQPQMELGAYATTSIFTSGATATRVADSFSRSNIYTNGLISASGGTWFVELRGNVAYTRDTGGSGLFLSTLLNTYNNSIIIYNLSGNSRLAIQLYQTSSLLTTYTTTTDTTKIAIKWNGTTADIFANGTKVVSNVSFTLTALENLSHSTSVDVPKFIQQMALFPTPLTDAQCQTLTT